MSSAFLADTHVILWALEGDSRMPAEYGHIINNAANEIYVSIASVWEMMIKTSIGKLTVAADIFETLEQADYQLLAIAPEHVRAVRDLPPHHRDPFDRMLIAQAKAERLTLLSADPAFRAYDVMIA